MPATLWTHSLEAQRRMLLSLVKELLELELQLRRQKLPVSLDELNQRLLLISRVLPVARRAPWTPGLVQEAHALLVRIQDLDLQAVHARLAAQSSEPDATGTSVG